MSNMAGGGDLGSSSRGTNDPTQRVKDTVREKTQQLTDAAKDQARTTYDQKKNIVVDELDSLASALREVGGRLRSENDGSVAARLTDGVAERIESVTTQFGSKNLDGLIRDVERFGRSNPAVFLGAAAALGFLAIRFLKSSVPQPFDEEGSSRPQGDVASDQHPFATYVEEV